MSVSFTSPLPLQAQNTIRLMVSIAKICDYLASEVVPWTFGHFVYQVQNTAPMNQPAFIRASHRRTEPQDPLPNSHPVTIFSRFVPPSSVVDPAFSAWDATVMFNVIENLRWLDAAHAEPDKKHVDYSTAMPQLQKLRNLRQKASLSSAVLAMLPHTLQTKLQNAALIAQLRELRNHLSHANMVLDTAVHDAGWEILTAAAHRLRDTALSKAQLSPLEAELQALRATQLQALSPLSVQRAVKELYADAVREKLDTSITHLEAIAKVLQTIIPDFTTQLTALKTEILNSTRQAVREEVGPLTALVQESHSGPVYVLFEPQGEGSVARFYFDEEHKMEVRAATVINHTQYPSMHRVAVGDERVSGVPPELFHLRELSGVLNLSLLMTQPHLPELQPFQAGMIASWQWSIKQNKANAFALPEPHFDGSRSPGTPAGHGKGISAMLAERMREVFTDIAKKGGLDAGSTPLQWFLAYVDLHETINNAEQQRAAASPAAASLAAASSSAASSPMMPASFASPKLPFGRQAIATEIFFRLLPDFLRQSELDAEHANIERVAPQRDTRSLPTVGWSCIEMIQLLLPGDTLADRRQLFLEMWRASHPQLSVDRTFTVLAHENVLIAVGQTHKAWPIFSIPASILARRQESALLSKERLTELREVIGHVSLLGLYTRRTTSNPILQQLQHFFICKAVNTAFILPSRELWEQLLQHYRQRLTLGDQSGASSGSNADDATLPTRARCVQRRWAKHFVFTVEFTNPDQLRGDVSNAGALHSEMICFSYLDGDKLHKKMRADYVHDAPLRRDSVLVLLCNAWLNTLDPAKELNMLLLPSEMLRVTTTTATQAKKKPATLKTFNEDANPASRATQTWLRWDRIPQPAYLAEWAVKLDDFKNSEPFAWFEDTMREFLVPKPPALPIGGSLHRSDSDLQRLPVAVMSQDQLLNRFGDVTNKVQWLNSHGVPKYIGIMHADLQKMCMNLTKLEADAKLTCPVIPFFLLTNSTMQRHGGAMIDVQRRIEAEIYFNFIAALCIFGVTKLVPNVLTAWTKIRESAQQQADKAAAKAVAKAVAAATAAAASAAVGAESDAAMPDAEPAMAVEYALDDPPESDGDADDSEMLSTSPSSGAPEEASSDSETEEKGERSRKKRKLTETANRQQ